MTGEGEEAADVVAGDGREADQDQQVRDYASAVEWVRGLIAGTPSSMLGRPTPCEGWDVRTLVGHLLGTAHRARSTATGIAGVEVPHVVVDVPDEARARVFGTITGEAVTAFAGLAAASSVRAPWGEVTAIAAARGFTVETVTHGWDLATAVGAPPDAPEGVAERCLVFATEIVPERLRGRMYAEPVPPQGAERPTERLAMLLGHHRERGTRG